MNRPPSDLLALLPDVNGRRVLDLGCGAGQLARHLATRGAAEVIGVDVSERMLECARTQWAHPPVSYQRAAIEEVTCAPARFDLVVSVLTLHYVDDYRCVVARIAEWLTPGGGSCTRRSIRSSPRACRTRLGARGGGV